MKKLPKRLFVTIVKDSEENYPVADTDLESFEDGAEIGMYELVEKSRLRIRRDLTPTKSKRSKR